MNKMVSYNEGLQTLARPSVVFGKWLRCALGAVAVLRCRPLRPCWSCHIFFMTEEGQEAHTDYILIKTKVDIKKKTKLQKSGRFSYICPEAIAQLKYFFLALKSRSLNSANIFLLQLLTEGA
jgi:hypothetical protein